jgi:hypothetical protein
VIVVGILGGDAAVESKGRAGTAELVTEVARRAAAAPAGPRVEMLGLVPGDATWDRVMVQLAQARVGHATVVRSARGAMEPADLDLALHYLPDIRAIVLAHPPFGLVRTALEAASWTGAPLLLIGPLEGGVPETPAGVQLLVVDAPERDPDGTFAGFVAAFAVRLDAGETMDAAWRGTLGSLAVDRV